MHVNLKFKNLACLWRHIYTYWNSEVIILIYLSKNWFQSQPPVTEWQQVSSSELQKLCISILQVYWNMSGSKSQPLVPKIITQNFNSSLQRWSYSVMVHLYIVMFSSWTLIFVTYVKIFIVFRRKLFWNDTGHCGKKHHSKVYSSHTW